MGSLCRSSPQVSNTSSSQTYTPAGASGMADIYKRVSQAANQVYNPYNGQLVANLNDVQNAGINNINQNAQAAQPYYAQAMDYANQGAADISQDDITRYQNPYTQNVINATQANFNESNQQQQSALRGNAALKGALGGDRAGIAGAELARQQNLAQNPVIAGLQQQNYTQALQAAQADRAAKAQGAFTTGSIGSAAQNAAIQGGQAQIGAGTVQQQNQQQNLGAEYQKYLNAQAFPYQQAQFLASYGLPALQAQGGTTTGQSTTTTQQPQASPFSQIMGAGLTAAGLFSGNPFMSLGGAGSMFGGGASAAPTAYTGTGNPWSTTGMYQFASGGRVGHADGGVVSPFSPTMNYSSGGVADHFRMFRGMLRDHYAEGGVVGRRNYGSGGIADDPEFMRARQAMFNNESYGGRYDAIGPMTRQGRAYGAGQVMERNIRPWTKKYYGQELSPQEYLANKEAQDAVINGEFGRLYQKYGPSGAARAWFAGEGGMNNPNLRDGYGSRRGTSVAEYENKFNRSMGIPQQDRDQLAAMAGAGGQPPMGGGGGSPIIGMPQGGGGNMDARRRAIMMGLAMLSGGGGSGFAYGGPVHKEFGGGMSIIPQGVQLEQDSPKAEDFSARWGQFPGAPLPGISPNQRVQESHGVNNPMDNPAAYLQMGKEALGQQPNSPYQIEPQNNWPTEAEEPSADDETQEAGMVNHTDISAQRADPYKVYQQNAPQGTSGDDIRQALIAAGLGMMAGRSSNAMTNIAEGGLKGLGQYNTSKKQRESAELAARRLMQQAEQFNQSLDLKNDQFNRQSENDVRRERMETQRLMQQERLATERMKMMQDREDRRAEAAVKKEADKPSPAERAVDAAFGKDYASWVAGGGFNSTKQNLKQLNDVIKELDSGELNISGPIIGSIPGQNFINSKGVDTQERVASVVQNSLKAILGGQFTEKEAQQLINRTYNPKQSEEVNADRLRRLFISMRNAAEMKQKAAQYYEENTTLKGFKGSAEISLNDIEKGADIMQDDLKPGDVRKGYRFKGGDRYDQKNWEKA